MIIGRGVLSCGSGFWLANRIGHKFHLMNGLKSGEEGRGKAPVKGSAPGRGYSEPLPGFLEKYRPLYPARMICPEGTVAKPPAGIIALQGA